MGWLRQAREELGITSDRKLAAAMLESPGCPEGYKTENLANYLGKLDKGDSGWWLATGAPWVPILAEVLHEEVDDLRARLLRLTQESSDAPDPDRLWPFRWLRALDLAVDALPPGLPWPPSLWYAQEPLRLWWAAGAGAGKTLLGRWLERRERWTFLRAATWTEARRLLPDSGQAFVELERPELSPATTEGLPEELVLFVAAPFEPGPWETPREDNADAQPPAWTAISAPPLKDWIDPMLAWVAGRVKPGGRFDLDEVVQLLKSLPRAEMFTTPGDLVDFLGLVDEVGASVLLGDSSFDAEALLRRWVRLALDQPGRSVPPTQAALLRHDGDRLILELVEARLRAGLPEALDLEAWSALVPRRRAPPIDRDRLLRLIQEATPEATREAQEMLKPSREDVLAALQRVGALARGGGDLWRIQPSWLAQLAQNVAVEDLIQEGPEGVGALLLHAQSSAAALRVLVERVGQGDLELAQACFDQADRQSPEKLAALEGAFRVLGHRVLLGDALPTALLHRAWDAQMAHVADRYLQFPPLPILGVAHADSEAITRPSMWIRAALAISQRLHDAGLSVPPQPLNPWGGLPPEGPSREAYNAALDRALSDFTGAREVGEEEQEIARACEVLALTIHDRLGPQAGVHGLEWALAPTLLVRHARAGAPLDRNGPIWRSLSLPGGLAPIERACAAEGVSIDVVIAWLWGVWSYPGDVRPSDWPPFAWASRDTTSPLLKAQAERLWRALPEAAITEAVMQTVGFREAIWPWLPRSFWSRWVEWQEQSRTAWHSGKQLWSLVPEDLLEGAVRDTSRAAHVTPVYNTGWQRIPERMLSLVDELARCSPALLQGNTDRLQELTHVGLTTHAEALLDRVERWQRDPAGFPGVGPWLNRWLLRAVEERRPGWRRAFALLAEALPTEPSGELNAKPTNPGE